MAAITITIPDNQIARVQDAFCFRFNFTGTAPDGTTETKNQFIKRYFAEEIKAIVEVYEVDVATKAAKAGAVPLNVT